MQMSKDYDIGEALEAIEDELIASMMRNIDRHRAEELEEGYDWTMWQAEQLRSLERYKRDNAKKYKKQFKDINGRIEALIYKAHETGGMEQEENILAAIRNGFKGLRRRSGLAQAEFFKLNDRKLEALIKATTDDLKRAEVAVLRMANDQYRKIIYNAQVYANTGAGTYEKAVDMATKDMLSAGLNCVRYANGARHTLSDYAEMAIRTASKRAYLQGEGVKRQEWGISTVIINKRGNPCPLCAPFVGKVMIDDVWSGGEKGDGKYPLLSTAIAAKLYHPNCKDSHTTYFPGISSANDTWTKEELEKIGADYKEEQKQQHAKRQTERFERLSEYSLDEDNKRTYGARAKQWKHVYFKTGGMTTDEYIDEQRRKAFFSAPKDITSEWQPVSLEKAKSVTDMTEYAVNGTKYAVDGSRVVLDYKPYEREVAEIIANKYGKEVQMVPRVLYPQHIKTADFKISGMFYDLKTPEGNGKNTIIDILKTGKGQSERIILALDKSPMEFKEVIRQVNSAFQSSRLAFMKEVIIFKEKSIIKVFRRNK